MRTGRKTAIIAKGIARFAEVQDLRGDDKSAEAAAIRHEWEAWTDAYPQWVPFVEAAQYRLFGEVNTRFD